MTINKGDIAEELFARNLFTKGESERIITTLFEFMKLSLENGEDILISGFGKFSVKEKHARPVRNLATGEAMMLEPRRVVTFKCSDVLRKKINGDSD